ncbi:MAG: DNA translocase FtsK [Chthonomonadales bacterium]|nr:DNA translocase FtsK [Chthonomonadales bacterium]
MKRKRPGAEQTAERSRRLRDISGLALCFCGLACLVWLLWRQQAPVPGILVGALRLLAGSGAYVFPCVMMFIGGMMLFGWQRFSLSHASIGSVLAFLTFAAWRHIAGDPSGLPADEASSGLFGSFVGDPQWSTAYVSGAGGYLGAALGWALTGLFGTTASYLFLVMFFLMALVLIVDKPVKDMLMSLKHPASAGARAVRKGVEAVRNGKSREANGKSAPAIKGVAEPGSKGPSLLERIRDQETVTAAGEPRTEGGKSRSRMKALPGLDDSVEDEPVTSTHVPQPFDNPVYPLPPISLLRDAPVVGINKKAKQELEERIQILVKTLDEFGIGANVVEIAHGPTVTRYEVQLAPGIKVARITSLADNLAMALEAINVRVEAPIPGKSAIGVEVPNANAAIVSLKECIESPVFRDSESKLTFALGKDVAGEIKVADLARMPHLLIGGSTNSGKSVCLNSLIASIVFRARPDEVRFLMVDPKRVELTMWEGIPHLVYPVVREVKQAAGILRAAIMEMDKRYDLLAAAGARNIQSYNEKVPEGERMPYLVIVIDELADLMAQAGQEIEGSIERLAHLARATGIHLVIATQRPSVDVITGTIKANIPSRIAFACIQAVDSRTILDRNGAERLIGRGDMLFLPIDAAKPVRIQGCYLSEAETEGIVDYLRSQDSPEYLISPVEENAQSSGGDDSPIDDVLFEKAVRLAVTTGHASASYLQRRLRIGYARSSRLVDIMEQRGIIGPPNGAKPREILITHDEMERLFADGASP